MTKHTKKSKKINLKMSKPILMNERKKKNSQSFSIYIYKFIRSITTSVGEGISKIVMKVANLIIYDFFDKAAMEFVKLVNKV